MQLVNKCSCKKSLLIFHSRFYFGPVKAASSVPHARVLACSVLHSELHKPVFSLLRRLSTRHCPHLLLSAGACCTAHLQLVRGAGARGYRSISANRALSSKLAVDRWYRQTDGQTDTRPFHRPCSADYAGSVSKLNDQQTV